MIIHREGAQMFMAALSTMAREGRVQGAVTFHADDTAETIKLPIDKRIIGDYWSRGACESIVPAMNATKELMKNADIVAFYTDANITDAPISADVRKNLAKNCITTFGLFVGPARSAESMSSYFDVPIIADSVQDLGKKFASLAIRRMRR